MHSREGIQKLNQLIRGIRFCMVTTLDDEGSLHSRPLTTQEADGDGKLWFFISFQSALVDEIHRNAHLNLSYADPEHNRYISISGQAQVLRDRNKAEDLWSPVYKAWFPEGLQDPNLALLKVEVEKAEYWDAPNSKLVQVIGFLKALATGERVSHLGEHKELH